MPSEYSYQNINMNIIISGKELTQLTRMVISGDNSLLISNPVRIPIPDVVQPKTEYNNIMSKKNGDDPVMPQYEFKDANNEKIVVCTTASGLFSEFLEGRIPIGGVCAYHLGTFDWEVYCYPIKHRVLRSTGINEDGKVYYFTQHEFTRDDTVYCGMACADKDLERLCSGRSLECNNAEECRTLIQKEFELRFPGQVFRRVKDRKLLKINKGHMEYDEWNSCNFTLYPTPFIINVPSKHGWIMRGNDMKGMNRDDMRAPNRDDVKGMNVVNRDGVEIPKIISPARVMQKKQSAFGNLTAQLPKGNFNPLKIIPKLG